MMIRQQIGVAWTHSLLKYDERPFYPQEIVDAVENQEVTTAQVRVDQLKNECPSDWSPMKNELDDLFGTVGSSVDRAWRDIQPGEIGVG